jgi:nucleoside-diphosphate-sugar epimerase
MDVQRVLITGGAGFLGFHLARTFRNHGASVRILDAAERPEWVPDSKVEYLRGDVRDRRVLGTALRDVDAVVHAAFASPRQRPAIIESVNIDGARVVSSQSASHGVRRFILVSSTIVQRAAAVHPWFDRAPLTCLDVYRKSRATAEDIVSDQAGRGMRIAVVRPKTFVGPGRVSAFTIIFDWIRRGKPVLMLGKGASRYQLIEIRDMAEGIRCLVSSDAEGLFFLGALEFGTIREDLQALLDHARTGSRLCSAPARLARMALWGMELAGTVPASEWHYVSTWGGDSVVDTSRTVKELGWRPRWSNAEALRNAYDWYVESIIATGAARTIHPLPRIHRMVGSLIETVLR